MFEHFHGDWAYVKKIVCCEVSKIFCHKMFTMVLLDGILDGFSKFWLFILENCILIWPFRVLLRKLYISMLWLRICENDFIDFWGKDFNCTEYKFWQFLHGHPNTCWANAAISSLDVHTRKQCHHWLSLWGNNFIACSANGEMGWTAWWSIHLVYGEGGSFTEGETHLQRETCLKRMGDKELIRETGDGRQGTET
jgi:hypothetical protein